MAKRSGGSLFIRAMVVLALLVGTPLLVAAIALKAFIMPAASMEPNLVRGDYFFALRAPFYAAPVRGDIIAFKLPSSGHIDFIKRLVGMPGDRVQLKGGHLFINDKPVAEKPLGAGFGNLPGGWRPVKLVQETNPEGRSYRIQKSPNYENAGDTGAYVVPPHCYFVLGDNRDNSLDSRFDPGVAPDDPKLGGCGWDAALDDKVGDQPGVGFVPAANIVGRVDFIVLSWNTGVDEEHPSGASVLKPWTWFTDARSNRFFKSLQ
jgi:signal peptidase I